jgi:polyphosphate kinase
MQIMMSDNVKAREQSSDGTYHYVKRAEDEPIVDSQQTLFQLAYSVGEDEE